MTWEQFIYALMGGIIAGIPIAWIWVTKVYIPSKLKQSDDRDIHNRKVSNSTQEFNELAQTNSLQSVLAIQSQLITHLIESNNGHMSKLTEAVMQGDKEHTAQLEKMTAAYNQALVTLSRAAAFPSIQRIGERSDIDELLGARVKTEAVQATDAIVAGAAAPDTSPKLVSLEMEGTLHEKEPQG